MRPSRFLTRPVSSLFLLVLLTVGGGWWFHETLPPSAQAQMSGDAAAETGIIDADWIRVGISDDAMTALEYPQTCISATGPFTIRDQTTGQAIFSGTAGPGTTITVNKQAFTLNTPQGRLTAAGPLRVQVLNPAHRLKITNITRRGEIPEFRGYFEIARGFSSPAKLTVINVVPLEDYLKAVVPNELPMRFGEEAVKAQAVAARNYAIRPREKPWKHFDICDSQYCQVYLGSQTETPGSNRVIAETEGLVGLYDGEPILALFSSSHGGYAEDYSYAFSDPITHQYPAPPIAYLRGGPDNPRYASLDLTTEAGARQFWTHPQDSYDVKSPHYRWEKRWSRAELEAAINQGLREVSKDTNTQRFVSPHLKPHQIIGTLKRLNVLRRGRSGKIMTLEIVGSNGTWTVQKEFVVRKVLTHGGRMLPSANVVFSHLTDAQGRILAVVAHGGGFGHGVGMSQLGASWMSAHGHPFPDIIRHYYKGASLGSKPIAIRRDPRPVMTQFVAKKPEGTLFVDTPQPGPVQVRLNGYPLTVEATERRAALPVGDKLKTQGLNTFILFPDAQHPDRPLKAWVELYPPQSP